jgi:hypothetical protein
MVAAAARANPEKRNEAWVWASEMALERAVFLSFLRLLESMLQAGRILSDKFGTCTDIVMRQSG